MKFPRKNTDVYLMGPEGFIGLKGGGKMKVIINGRTVYLPPGAEKKGGNEKAREQLQARYPGVTFSGDCSRIKIDRSVRIGQGTQITQIGEAELEIRGNSTIGRMEAVSFALAAENLRSLFWIVQQLKITQQLKACTLI
jgi:hypothetical protein